MEERLNGWSKINFDGKEGFIKSEYLEPEETEMALSTEVPENVKTEDVPEIDNSTPKKAILTETVNVRKTPSTDADIIVLLSKGTEIEVIEQMNNGWTKINHTKGQAYVKSNYVRILGELNKADVKEETAENNTTETKTKKGSVTTTVKVRKDSSTNADVVGRLSKGSAIEIIEQMSNGWTKIKHSSGTAYVKSDYVKVK